VTDKRKLILNFERSLYSHVTIRKKTLHYWSLPLEDLSSLLISWFWYSTECLCSNIPPGLHSHIQCIGKLHVFSIKTHHRPPERRVVVKCSVKGSACSVFSDRTKR